METTQYKSIVLSLTLILAPLSGRGSDPDLTVLVSSDSEFQFLCDFESDLQSLEASTGAISLPALERVIQVAVPPGAEARLITVYGRGTASVINRGLATGDRGDPVELAALSRPTTIRGRQTVGVRVSPVENGIFYQAVEVHVGFSRTRPPAYLSAVDDPIFDRVWSAALANHEVAKNWPVLSRERTVQTVAAGLAAKSLTAAVQWYQVKVSQTGLVRITGAQLAAAGINLGDLASDSIRIFNAGGLPNSVDNAVPRPEFQEISLMILDGGDGSFGTDDQLFFYGEAPDRWVYRSGAAPTYVNNPYTNQNVYWLAVSGSFDGAPARMEQIDGSPVGPPTQTITECWQRLHLEQDNLISTESDGHVWDFYNWFWTDETDRTLQLQTPGAVENGLAYVHVQGRSGSNIVLRVNGLAALITNCGSSSCRYETRQLKGGPSEDNQFELTLAPLTSEAPPFLDYLEVVYQGALIPSQGRIDFAVDSVSGPVDVQLVDNFSVTPSVFDISDPLNPTIISGFVRQAGVLTFRATTSSDGPNRYYIAATGQAASPVAITPTDFTNLRAGYQQTDLIIVTARSLEPYLDEYVAYRSAQGIDIQLVTVADVMNCFSYGLYDPTAIRDFLKFAYEEYPAPAPAIVLFVGDASYDFMDHLGTGVTNLVPSYIRPGDRTYSDDNYVYFGEFGILDYDRDRGFDMMTARWPVQSASEINGILSKIKTYEAPSSLGSWRTRLTLVADDEHTRDRHNEVFHTTQTEILEKQYVPRYLNRQKIYLWEYPFVNREKPEVNKAIVGAFNQGSLIVNYVGHGNPDVWSHEHVFQRGSDLPRLQNADRLPLVYAASCDIGFFDDPTREGMAEDLLAVPSGGAIGVISATRLVYAADNAQFNRAVYASLFGDLNLTICEAMFAAKVQRQYVSPTDTIPHRVDNDRAYSFLGDPLLRLGLPRLQVEFTQQPDSLVALGTATLSGRIVDELGTPVSTDGTLYLCVYDSDRERAYRLPDDTSAIVYHVTGPTIYRGSAGISAGSFQLQFVTPLDVGYRGSSARVSAYAVLGGSDAIGLVDSLRVSETQAVSDDHEGPEIRYGVAGRDNFVAGALLNRHESLIISISDRSGVNLVGSIGHGITLTLDGEVENSINLTDRFEFARDDFTSGSLIYPLSYLETGRHRFKTKAWDNANNVSTVEFDVEITADDHLVIRDLLNHPNPMSDLTTFYFELSQPVDELSVEIYTLSGKNIWFTSRYGLGADAYPNGSAEIVWDGRDGAGDRVAAGVYIYRVSALSELAARTAEEFGKVVVLN